MRRRTPAARSSATSSSGRSRSYPIVHRVGMPRTVPAEMGDDRAVHADQETQTLRQLTSLDAQFLAVESARTYGHVGSLAIYDPSTAPGGEITVKDLCRMVGERLHLLPPFHWKLVDVPLGIDLPYWIEDPDFDLDFHI